MKEKIDLVQLLLNACEVSDDEVIGAIFSIPTHYSLIYANAQSNTGTCVLTQPAAAGVTWNLTYLEISLSGSGYSGPGATLTIYDGTIATGTVLFKDFLSLPVGSVGTVQKINIPNDALNRPSLQAVTGNAMTIVVAGVGSNQISINARFTDGLPGGSL